MFYINLKMEKLTGLSGFRTYLSVGLVMTRTIYLQSNRLQLDHIHLIPLHLKTKPKRSTDLNRPHLDRQGGELI